jgi:hypothetical protein
MIPTILGWRFSDDVVGLAKELIRDFQKGGPLPLAVEVLKAGESRLSQEFQAKLNYSTRKGVD